MAKINDLTGELFGRLTVVERSHNTPAGNARWVCRCECGNIKTVIAYSLVQGKTKSCGCIRLRNLATTKICSHCKEEKPYSEYRWNKTTNQWGAYCRICLPITARERYRRNPEWPKFRTKRRNKEIKIETFSMYGGCCSCCGEKNIEFLAIDHINGGGGAHRKSIGMKTSGVRFYRWLKAQGYPSGFQVLCHNCNFGKHVNKGVCPHKMMEVPAMLSFGG